MIAEVDMIMGPETGVINAAGGEIMPKVVFLSHSTHENLTRDWVNVRAITSAKTSCPGRGENEAPACHQMHYSWEFCKQVTDETSPHAGTAQCQADIDGDAAWAVIREAIESTTPQAQPSRIVLP